MTEPDEGPQIADAPEDAPAGMKRSEIRLELAEEHGINMNTTRQMRLGALVHTLIESRLSTERKQEQAAKAAARPAPLDGTHGRPTPEEFKPVEAYPIQVKPSPVVEDDDDDMLDDFEDDDEPTPIEEVAAEAQAALDEIETLSAEYTEVSGARIVRMAHVYSGGKGEPVVDLPDPVCKCGTELSAHDSVDPPHGFVDQGVVVNDDDDDLSEDILALLDGDYDEVAAEMDEVAAAQPAPLFVGMPGTNDYRFDNHAGAGPSGAERWMNCTASLQAVREFLETLSPGQQRQYAGANLAARQGTTAHAAAESELRLLLGEISPERHDANLLALTLEPPVEGEAYDSDMADFLTEYTDFIQAYIDTGHEVTVEARVEAFVPITVEGAYTHVYEDGDELADWYAITGSVDAGIMPTPAEMVLTAVDLKYGEGLDVDVESNPQVRIYMLGLLARFIAAGGDIDKLLRLDYAIVQPRLGGIKLWTESVDDLLTWRDEVLAPALTAALGFTESEFLPSDETCQWCPVKGSCPALTKQRIEAAGDLFEAVNDAEVAGHDTANGLPDKEALSNDALGALLAQVQGLVNLEKDLKAEATRRAQRGEEVPGYVLVSYTPPRKWKEGAEAALKQTPAAWRPRTLLTPKQAEVALGDGAAKIEKWFDAPAKHPVLAHEKRTNGRKVWEGRDPHEMFPDEG